MDEKKTKEQGLGKIRTFFFYFLVSSFVGTYTVLLLYQIIIIHKVIDQTEQEEQTVAAVGLCHKVCTNPDKCLKRGGVDWRQGDLLWRCPYDNDYACSALHDSVGHLAFLDPLNNTHTAKVRDNHVSPQQRQTSLPKIKQQT